MHVHGKFNSEADTLSNKALKQPVGWLFYEETVEGDVVSTDKIFIF
jgi:hypothetical protein